MASYYGSWSDAYSSSATTADQLCVLRAHPFVPGALDHPTSTPDESIYAAEQSWPTWSSFKPADGVGGGDVLASVGGEVPKQSSHVERIGIEILEKLDQVSARHLLLIWHQCAANSSLTCVLDFIQRHMAPELQEGAKTDPIIPQVVYKVDIRMSYETWRDWNAILEKFGCATDRSFAEGYAQFIKWLDISDPDIPLQYQQAHGALICKVVSIGRNLEDFLGELIHAHSPSWTT
ncbi:hypothetical protein IQ07DRAFT_670311 [Pyrenochaeta sp. DS3sAY3a]|nr:hypothetical protein IQ07DRAFT_670311 [Pyrenochaeta sp. DS3sAY3a]